MLLTPKQLQHFWRSWSAVCQAQGWTDKETAEAQRHAMIQRCGFGSLKSVDRGRGFDRVLAELGRLRDHVGLTIESDDESIGEARRIRHVIRTELYPCIALYRNPDTYLAEVIRDKFGGQHPGQRLVTLEDLTARPITVEHQGRRVETDSQLHQLLSTLSARLNVLRNEAGDSIHTMKKRAGLPCYCASICRPKAAFTAKGPREFKLDPTRTFQAKPKPAPACATAGAGKKEFDPTAGAKPFRTAFGDHTGD